MNTASVTSSQHYNLMPSNGGNGGSGVMLANNNKQQMPTIVGQPQPPMVVDHHHHQARPQTKITGFFKSQMKQPPPLPSNGFVAASGPIMSTASCAGGLPSSAVAVKKDITNLAIRSKEFPKQQQAQATKRSRAKAGRVQKGAPPTGHQTPTIKDIIMKKPVAIAPRIESSSTMTNKSMQQHTSMAHHNHHHQQTLLQPSSHNPQAAGQQQQQPAQMHSQQLLVATIRSLNAADSLQKGGNMATGDPSNMNALFQYPITSQFVTFPSQLIAQSSTITTTTAASQVAASLELKQQQQQSIYMKQTQHQHHLNRHHPHPQQAQFILNGALMKLATAPQQQQQQQHLQQYQQAMMNDNRGDMGGLRYADAKTTTALLSTAMPIVAAQPYSSSATSAQPQKSAAMFVSMPQGSSGQIMLNATPLQTVLAAAVANNAVANHHQQQQQQLPQFQPIGMGRAKSPIQHNNVVQAPGNQRTISSNQNHYHHQHNLQHHHQQQLLQHQKQQQPQQQQSPQSAGLSQPAISYHPSRPSVVMKEQHVNIAANIAATTITIQDKTETNNFDSKDLIKDVIAVCSPIEFPKDWVEDKLQTPVKTVPIPPDLISPKSLVLERIQMNAQLVRKCVDESAASKELRVDISNECLDVAKRQLGVLVTPPLDCAKSPILSQPKTIRFPARSSDERQHRKGCRKSSGNTSTGNCYWEGCDDKYENSSKLLDHLQTQHVNTQKGPFSCHWTGCRVNGRESCSRNWLEGHVLSHGGSKTFKCIFEGCGQRFGTQVTIDRSHGRQLTSFLCKCVYVSARSAKARERASKLIGKGWSVQQSKVGRGCIGI